MHKRFYIFLVFSLVCLYLKAQPALDTIKASLKQKPHLYGKFDTRNSFISNRRAKIFGVKMGLNYGNYLHIGVGYNQLNQPAKDFDKKFFYTNSNGFVDSTMAHLHLYYISAGIEYIYYRTKKWELSMPLQLGVGQTRYSYQANGEKKERSKSINFIYEPAVSVQYKFVTWFGVGADVGYRFMFTADKELNQQFNSPTYAFKVLIYYNELYKLYVSKKQKEKKN